MKKSNFLLHIVFSLTIVVFTSCVSDIDFDQTEDILPTPVFESSLIYSNLEAPNFIDETTQEEIIVLTDTTRLEFINSDFFVDQLLKTELRFEFTNTLDRTFNVDFEFVNDNDEQRYLAQVEVPNGQPNNPIFVQSNFLIEEPELTTFEEATKLIYRITLPANTNPINASSLGRLKLESKATFFFEL